MKHRNKLYAALIALVVLFGFQVVAAPAASAAGPVVTVGNAYSNAGLTGTRVHIDINPYQGPCDGTGYVTHNPSDPGKKYNTGISSVSLGNAGNGWQIDNCKYLVIYTGTQGTSNFHACQTIHGHGNLSAACNDVATYIGVHA